MRYTAGELLNAEIPIPDGLIGRMMLPGTISVIAGPSGIGKTWIVMKMAWDIATGSHFGSLPVKNGRVLFISEEMVAWEMKERFAKYVGSLSEGSEDADSVVWHFKTGLNLVLPDHRRRLDDLIVSEGSPPLVIIDCLRDVHSLREADNDGMSIWMKRVRDRIAVARECCILFVHHFGKANEFHQGSQQLRGASVINDVCSEIVLVVPDGDSRQIVYDKVRHGPKPETMDVSIEEDDKRVVVRIEASGGSGADSDGRRIKELRELLNAEGGSLPKQVLLSLCRDRLSWSTSTTSKAISSALEAEVIERGTKIGSEVILRIK